MVYAGDVRKGREGGLDMKAAAAKQAVTVAGLRARKGDVPIVCLTAYTSLTAKLLDEHVDLLLVGDSVGMVLYGLDTTIGVTLEMMIAHGSAVTRGAERALVIVDMPFGSYQESPQAAFRSCSRVMMETGCAGIKLEGGADMAETIRFLTRRGIPVMGHVGLMPQSVHIAGGYRCHGKDAEEAGHILAHAKAVAEAGAFAIVIEGTVEPLARKITKAVSVPTIGIGASPACDGQILVTEDIIGLFSEFTPRFVKRYAELGRQISAAAKAYGEDVRAGRFPGPEHCFGVKKKKEKGKG